MAQLKDLIVSGSSRLLGTLYCNNLNVNGGATFNGTTSFNGALTAKGNVSAISTSSSSDDGYLITTSHGRTMKIGALNSSWIHMYSGGTPIILDAGFFTTSSTGDLGSTSYRWSTLYCKGINNSGNITASGTLNITGKSTLGETVASTLKTATINTENINVSDTLRSSKWEIETISNMGGSLYVSPTLQIANGSTCVVQQTTSTTFTLTIIDSTNITADSLGGHVWSSGSKVKLSGTIGEVVLGTCNATLSAKMNATSGRLSLTVTSDQATLFSTASTNLTCKNLNVMLYQVANGTNMYPVGIYMTSYGVNKYSYIDIYNGAQTGITTRIGKLDGAPAVNNTSPTGYGIYTNNGYFDGVIVSQSGKIGGFTLGASSISNGKTSYSETTNNGVWLGTDGIGLGKGTFYVTNAGALTATSGTIGGWSLNANYLYSQNTGASPTAAGGTTRYWVALNKYSSASTKAFEVWKSEWPAGASAKTDSYPFYVRYDGYMFASKGQIANWTLDINSLQTGTWGTDNSAMLCTGTSGSKSIGGSSSISGWVFTAGANFGVTKTGALYASSATISGAITATSLTISDAVKTAAGIASSSEIDNKANAAESNAKNASLLKADYLTPNKTTIDGGKITANTITANQISTDYVYGGIIYADKVVVVTEDDGTTTTTPLQDSIDSAVSSVADSINDLESDVSESLEEIQNNTDTLATQYGHINEQLAMELVAQGYASIENGILTLGNKANSIKAKLSSTKLAFTDASGSEVAYIGQTSDGVGAMHITQGVIEDDLRFGQFQWITRSNGNMSLKYIG